MRKRAKQVFVTRELCLSKATALLRKVTSERTSISICIYLFNDNLAAGTSLNGAVLSCHVELAKTQRHRTQKSNSRHKETWKITTGTLRIFYRIPESCQQHENSN